MNKNYILILLLLCGVFFANGNAGGNSVKSSDDFPTVPSETKSTYVVASSGGKGMPAEIEALLQETEIEISEGIVAVPVFTEPISSSSSKPTTWKSSVESSEPTKIVSTEMVPVFKVNPNVINVDNEPVLVPVQKVIQISNKNVDITITVTPNSVKLADGNVTAHAKTEIVIKNGTVIAGNTKIVTPAKVAEQNKLKDMNTLELRLENSKPVYDITSKSKKKLFGLLPVDMDVKSKVNAENGKLVSEQKPWWAFLTTN